MNNENFIGFNKITIYCFSGTGNSLLAARWISATFENSGISSRIVMIDKYNNIEFPNNQENSLIGFHFPTHGFCLPWHMLKFIWRFPRSSGIKKGFYLLNTRAGAKVYKLFTPGISGIAILLPFVILLAKGYVIKGILPLDPPSNWISIHPGFRQKVVDSIISRCKGITERFAMKMLNGTLSIRPSSYISLPIDIALIPVSLAYLALGRFFMAKTFYASSTCDGCKICEANCPVKAIEIVKSRPYWKFRCESCMRCMNICPKKSINTIHLYAAGIIWLISFFPVSKITTEWLINLWPAVLAYLSDLVTLTVLSLYSLPLLWISYHIVHQTSKIKVINAILTYTSLTRYWRRYIAPGIKAKSYKKPMDIAI